MQGVRARAEVLAALEAVNLVVVFDEDTPLELIRRVRPKVLASGDYRREQVVGRELVEADGGEVIFTKRVPGFSTSRIVQRPCAPQSDAKTDNNLLIQQDAIGAISEGCFKHQDFSH